MNTHIRRSRWTLLIPIIIIVAGILSLVLPVVLYHEFAILLQPLVTVPSTELIPFEFPVTWLAIGILLLLVGDIWLFSAIQSRRGTALEIVNKELLIIKHGTLKGQLHGSDIITADFYQGFFGRLTDTAILTIHATVPGRKGTTKQKSFKIGRIAGAYAASAAISAFQSGKQRRKPAAPRTKKTADAGAATAKTTTAEKKRTASSRKSSGTGTADRQETVDTFDYPDMTAPVRKRKNADIDVERPLGRKEAAARAEYLERTAGSQKGAEFEDEIDELLHTRDAIPTHHQVLKTLFVPYGDGSGRMSEIDNVAITETGIYVFECKNYDGTIYGKKDDKTWTVVYDSGETRASHSPILQNGGHIRTLSELLGIPKTVFRSVIVFSGHSNLNGTTFERDGITITSRDTLSADLRQRLRADRKVLSAKEVDRIFTDLLPYTEATYEARLRHLNQVEKAAQENA
ncbi:MAG TPA: nuclease-related domain-containing protein [Methanocorpusculum sp.]|nr:nuclease-related domain-containing protein [Methanocorpusculum sp.]